MRRIHEMLVAPVLAFGVALRIALHAGRRLVACPPAPAQFRARARIAGRWRTALQCVHRRGDRVNRFAGTGTLLRIGMTERFQQPTGNQRALETEQATEPPGPLRQQTRWTAKNRLSDTCAKRKDVSRKVSCGTRG